MTRRPLTVPLEASRHYSDGPWGLALALDVVDADFGAFARRLADGLTALGRPTRSELTSWLARNCPGEHAPTLTRKVRACGRAACVRRAACAAAAAAALAARARLRCHCLPRARAVAPRR